MNLADLTQHDKELIARNRTLLAEIVLLARRIEAKAQARESIAKRALAEDMATLALLVEFDSGLTMKEIQTFIRDRRITVTSMKKSWDFDPATGKREFLGEVEETKPLGSSRTAIQRRLGRLDRDGLLVIESHSERGSTKRYTASGVGREVYRTWEQVGKTVATNRAAPGQPAESRCGNFEGIPVATTPDTSVATGMPDFGPPESGNQIDEIDDIHQSGDGQPDAGPPSLLPGTDSSDEIDQQTTVHHPVAGSSGNNDASVETSHHQSSQSSADDYWFVTPLDAETIVANVQEYSQVIPDLVLEKVRPYFQSPEDMPLPLLALLVKASALRNKDLLLSHLIGGGQVLLPPDILKRIRELDEGEAAGESLSSSESPAFSSQVSCARTNTARNPAT